MMADLHLALSDASALVQALYSTLDRSTTLEAEESISTAFKSLFPDQLALQQIPILTPNAKFGSLARFTAMVQDSGLATEVYQSSTTTSDGTPQTLLFGLEQQESNAPQPSENDYSNLGERQAVFLINVPAQTAWYNENIKQNIPTPELAESIANLSLDPSATPNPFFESKFPIPSEPHFGTIAKIYGQKMMDSVQISRVYEFVGIVGETPLSTPFEDLLAPSPTDDFPAPQFVPALHVLFTLPPAKAVLPAVSEEEAARESLRNQLVDYLALGTGGDRDAAEWVLLAILARIHTRHPTGLSLGSMSLNLSFPIPVSPSASTTASTSSALLHQILSSLLPKISLLPLSIPLLNAPTTHLVPQNKTENLESGALQLSNDTLLFIDMVGVGEGVLGDWAVRGLRALSGVITKGRLEYWFDFSEFELDCEIGIVLVSEGRSFVPTSCVVQVQPATSSPSPLAMPDETRLNLFRSFIQTIRFSEFKIPSDMSEIIQTDFVNRRQQHKSSSTPSPSPSSSDSAPPIVPPSIMTQEDLLFRMTAARLLALSYGKSALDEISWTRASALDERRKGRLALLGTPSVQL